MRIPRIIVPEQVYHLTHRGNRRAAVFLDDDDRRHYCFWLDHYARRHSVDVFAYCLMSNHVHLVATPAAAASLSETIHDAHRRHALWMNRRYSWSGHLWANRFYSTPLDSVHFRHAVRYVELNPVRAGLVENAFDHSWSSAAEHCGRGKGLIALADLSFPEIRDWSTWLRDGLDPENEGIIRRNTYTGRPTGHPAFCEALEARVGRTLQPRKRGRPPRRTEIR